MIKGLWRTWLVLLGVSSLAVPLCIAYVDRPLAEFFDAHTVSRAGGRVASIVLLPLRASVLLVFFYMLFHGMKNVATGGVRRSAPAVIVCAISVVISVGAEFILKQLFGRADVDPTFIRDHRYGFDFLHARDGWWAFPSGTSMALFALVGVLYLWRARGRLAAASFATLVSIGVTVLNYHWLSDTLAGAFIGLTIGYATAGMIGTTDVSNRDTRVPEADSRTDALKGEPLHSQRVRLEPVVAPRLPKRGAVQSKEST